MTDKPAIAYADGSCLGNPGPGGWGVVIIEPDGKVIELSGGEPKTTNNRMEMTAAIEALRRTAPGARVILHSDSRLVINTMNLGWKRKANTDLWRLLDAESALRRVTYQWVPGHEGIALNERADALAQAAARRAQRAWI
jgi:ribonuclease HI